MWPADPETKKIETTLSSLLKSMEFSGDFTTLEKSQGILTIWLKSENFERMERMLRELLSAQFQFYVHTTAFTTSCDSSIS